MNLDRAPLAHPELGLEPTRSVSDLVTRHLAMAHIPGEDYGLASYATILAGDATQP